MMRRARFLGLLAMASVLPMAAVAADPGRDTIGKLNVRVYFGTDGDASVVGDKAAEVSKETIKLLREQEQLKFSGYRLLGSDIKPIFRSYENWAQPISGNDEILCRFEVQKQMTKQSMRLDLELWLSRKKILKSGVVLQEGKPVLVLGPEWRGGHLIISVELEPKRAS